MSKKYIHRKSFMRYRAWVSAVKRSVVFMVLIFSFCVPVGYLPAATSETTGERKISPEELRDMLNRLPLHAEECFICEQLGLCFGMDYSQVSTVSEKGYPCTTDGIKAHFVSSDGEIIRYADAMASAHEKWYECYEAVKGFEREELCVLFKDKIQGTARNTAKYLLQNMPEEHRWLILALMGKMVYNDRGVFEYEQDDWCMDNGVNVRVPHAEGRDYCFTAPDGKERDIRAILDRDHRDWRWRQIVWYCANILGTKNILALFPREVKAMRAHYAEKEKELKKDITAKSEALLKSADAEMSACTEDKRFARLAMAMGLYYKDHQDAGYADGHLTSEANIILPDGTKHTGKEFADEDPGILQYIPHDVLLEHYRQPIEQMAGHLLKERVKELPAPLRDLLRTMFSRQFILIDGSPAEIMRMEQGGFSTVQTFNRSWRVPTEAPLNRKHAYFKDSDGQLIPFIIYGTYERKYGHTLRLISLCAHILGKEKAMELIPRGTERKESGKVKQAATEDEVRIYGLLKAADDEMSSLTERQRLARIADAVGLHYGDHQSSGYNPNYNWLNPDVTILLPNGEKCTWNEVMDEKPMLLQLIPHDEIVKHYRQPIEQMIRRFAEVRFKEMPPLLRDFLRAQLARKLLMQDESPAELSEGVCPVQTFDRTWQLPVDVPSDREHTYFKDSEGRLLPISVCNTYEQHYKHTISIVRLCAHILGNSVTRKLIPAGNAEIRFDKSENLSDNSARNKVVSQQNETLARGQTALNAMNPEQRRAWLAEKMGFCYTENGDTAYQSERSAGENAVYVDVQGSTCKLSEVRGKESTEWVNATNAARTVGFDMQVIPYKGEIKQLATQTCKNILTNMPAELRQSWLAERNGLFFVHNNSEVVYTKAEVTLESGIRVSFRGSSYGRCRYFNPYGKVVQPTPVPELWHKRWSLLYYCEFISGINAINALFPEEVEAMKRSASKDSAAD